MLQLIRSTVGTWVVKILFTLLIVSFAVWGIGDIFRSKGQTNTVAEIGSIKINASELDREFRQQLNRLRPMFGGQLDMEQARQLGLVDQTLDQIIQRTLLDLAATDADLKAGDELVKRRLQQIPAFRNEQGQFEPELLRRALAANGMSEGALVTMIREETGRNIVSGAVSAGATVPDLLADALFRYRREMRSAETLTIANDGMPEPAAPDEAELTRYHEDKAVRFTAPEFRALTVGLVTVLDLAKTVEVGEEEIKTAYEERSDEFRTAERRTFQQVLVENEDQARRILEAARASGGDLAAAAAAEKAEIATLGPSIEAELPEIGVSVFAIDPETLPDPIKSDLGWHVLKVTKIEPAQVRKIAEVRDEVVAQLRKDRANETMPRLINMIEDALAGGSTLEEAASKFRFRLVKLDAVDASGAKPDGAKVADVPGITQISQNAFNLVQGARSSVIEAEEGVSFMVRVDSIVLSHLKPLVEVRDQVISGWKAEQRAQAAAKKAEDIEAKFKAGATLEALAKSNGAVVATVGPLARDPVRGEAKLPPDLLNTLFTLAPGGIGRAATADGQVLARLKEIIPADPKAVAGQLASLVEIERRAGASDLMAQYIEGLRARWPVQVNQERINQMFSSN
ncbi:MAG: SurA N-terminal domain-containing protein [Rhodospirillaceae bacterium]